MKSASPCSLVISLVMERVRETTYSVDQDRHLLQDTGHQAVERHHPISSEQEVSVDIKVATFVAVNFGAKRLHHLRLVEPLADPSELSVAERSTVLALYTDVIGVLSSALVRANDSIIAVDSCRNT